VALDKNTSDSYFCSSSGEAEYFFQNFELFLYFSFWSDL
jgi:hypothetical protein